MFCYKESHYILVLRVWYSYKKPLFKEVCELDINKSKIASTYCIKVLKFVPTVS